MREKIPVAVLGATGSVGQRFIQLLSGHPWFQVVALTASDRSIGLTYREACHWLLSEPMPPQVQDLTLIPSDAERMGVGLVFSAIPGKAAMEVEEDLAKAGVLVCSNASAHRMDVDVPILLPEINPDHVGLLEIQRKRRGWPGGIVTNANCTITGMSVAVKALQDAFGVRGIMVTSLQALSGAGFPGVASLDIADNVVPFIADEEEKMESEPLKILGHFDGQGIHLAGVRISAHANRVAVSDGHTVCLSVDLERPASPEEAAAVLSSYTTPQVARDLPSAPQPPILVRSEPDRPQPRLDRMLGGGMTTVVGRLRPDPIFDLRLVVLSHNTIRGAAGGSIYNAELLVSQGWVEGVAVPHSLTLQRR
jgi:aspartate-semialdehyde dehydrogenase